MTVLPSGLLVGRESELHRLLESYAQVLGGHPCVAVIVGEAGIGKTRLLRELELVVASERGQREAAPTIFATGHGVDLTGGAVPYGVAAGLLQDLVEQVGVRPIIDALGDQAASLAPLVPALAAGKPIGQLDRLALVGASCLLFTIISRVQPVVLVVEDLHWVDTSSLDLLVSWAVALRRGRLMMILSARPEPSLQGLNELGGRVASFARLGGCVLIELAPLTPDQVAEQVNQTVSFQPPGVPVAPEQEAVFLEEIQRLSDGVPLFVEELVAQARRVSSTGHGRVLGGLRLNLADRLHGLDQDGVRVLGAASLDEHPITAHLLASVVQLSARTVSQALDVASRRGLLDPLPQGKFRFHHALIREAVASSLAPSDLPGLHERWARALAKAPSSSQPAMVVAIANHWWLAGPSAPALAATVKAADVSERFGAAREARPHWRRVLAIMDDNPALAKDALYERALAHLGNRLAYPAAEILEVVAQEEQRVPPPAGVRRVWVWAHKASSRLQAGYEGNKPGVGECRSALVTLSRSAPTLLVFDAAETLMSYAHWAGLPRSLTEDILQEMERVAADLQEFRPSVMVVEWRAILAAGDGRIDDFIADTLDLIARTDGVDRKSNIYYRTLAVEAFAARGDLHEAVTRGLATMQLMAEPELELRWAPLATVTAEALMLRGDWTDAVSLLESVLDVSGESQGHEHRVRATLALRRGDKDTARAMFRGACDRIVNWEAPALPNPALFSPRLIAAQLAATEGNFAEARNLLRPILQEGSLAVVSESAWIPVLTSARYSWRHPIASPDDVGLTRAAAARIFHWGSLGAAWQAEMEAQLARWEAREQVDLWRRARDAWERVGAIYEVAECRLRLAESLLFGGGGPDSVERELNAAMVTAVQLQAAGLTEEIVSTARNARIRLASANFDHVANSEALTPRERDVLLLVAQGCTNGEIGKMLLMSPKTASVHLSHLIAKFDVKNRTELVAMAHRKGLLNS